MKDNDPHLSYCDCCKKAPVQIIEPVNRTVFQNYQLCFQCHHRLITRTLRPIEWYHLAVMQGGPNEYFLHDDFYDNEGHAIQPDEEVDDKEIKSKKYAIPQLDTVKNDINALLDYTFLNGKAESFKEFEKFDGQLIFDTIKSRYESGCVNIQDSLLWVLGNVCPREYLDKEWLILLWRQASVQYVEKIETLIKENKFSTYSATALLKEYKIPLLFLSKLILAVLSEKSVFFFLSLLEQLPEIIRDKVIDFDGLGSEELLNWIEKNIDHDSPVWWNVAVNSHIDWNRIVLWLEKSKSMNRIALGALILLSESRPQIFNGAEFPTLHYLETVFLKNYEKESPVSKQRVTKILNNLKKGNPT